MQMKEEFTTKVLDWMGYQGLGPRFTRDGGTSLQAALFKSAKDTPKTVHSIKQKKIRV